VRVASRKTGINADTGQGLREAMTGVHAVVDASNMNRQSYDCE
jgi:hypothetical protein